jgi:hypothetical protein
MVSKNIWLQNKSLYIIYLLTPWSRVLLDKITVNFAASQEIPRIYETQKFFTIPTWARYLSLSWANSIQSPRPPPTSWRSILILSSHLRLGLPNSFFPSGFPTNTLCTPLSLYITDNKKWTERFTNFQSQYFLLENYSCIKNRIIPNLSPLIPLSAPLFKFLLSISVCLDSIQVFQILKRDYCKAEKLLDLKGFC